MQEDYLDKSIVAANFIQKSFVNRLKRRDRTVKQAGFLVLRNTFMPSVLVETGFLTNKSEGSYLNSNKGQNEMADAISDAIINYFKALDNPSKYSENLTRIDKYEFKIQISASKRLLPLKSYNFNGLTNLSVKKVGSIYKYFFGLTNSYDEAKKLLRKSKSSGYKSSFIVLEKNGKAYDLDKYLSEI
jgi:N-acetylmuramoyl-L-alanine amidase